MICKVISTIDKYKMLENCSCVIVAVSGGADSVALLSILNCLKSRYGIRVIAAHVNHCLRGEESDRDESFVRDFCNKNSIELHVLRKDIKKLAKQTGLGLEECGRNIRYEFFNSISYGALVATAHTLNDRVETMLFNLSRGSTLRGLCSIPAVRGNIIRPLIDCSREEIEEYCSNNKIQYVTDSTNTNTEFARNRIRHNVVSELKKINPALEAAVLRCITSISEDEDFLSITAEKLVTDSQRNDTFNINSIKNAHPSIRKRAIAQIIKDKTGKVSPKYQVEHVESLLFTGGKTQVITGAYLEVKGDTLSFPKDENKGEKWCLNVTGELLEFPYGTARFKVVNKKDLEYTKKINKDILDNCFDYDRINGKLHFRSRIEGDKVKLSGRGYTKSLRKLFNEYHVPVYERNKIAILADDSGILWIEGFGSAERCRVYDSTKKVMIVDIGRILDAQRC
ncbi:MAG: tRNA lysidine(34) synthetase TilS [Clostridiales bacterium]|nr:tRNA lysidine(34) synthetase TilS [Clostridiales bacterium]